MMAAERAWVGISKSWMEEAVVAVLPALDDACILYLRYLGPLKHGWQRSY